MRSAVKRAQAQGGRSGVIYALLTMISPALEYVYKKVLAAGWTGITFYLNTDSHAFYGRLPISQ